MNPRAFLLSATILFAILALGSHTLLGPTPDASLFGSLWYLDEASGILTAATALVCALILRFVPRLAIRRYAIAVIGAATLALGALAVLNRDRPVPNLGLFNVEVPLEALLLFAIAAWALWVAFIAYDDGLTPVRSANEDTTTVDVAAV